MNLSYERVLSASPERVFALFTSAEGQLEFYGKDDPGWIVESTCDLRVGGAWTIAFGPSRDELYRHRHEFSAIEPPHRLLMTTTETRLDGSTLSFTSEFTFAPHAEGTLMAVTQSGFPTRALREEHMGGTPHAFDRLAAVL